jgi:2-polyprenyl-3-methyl-5-hydroxy-6-metoxy-1,4-benzoquinol methylase
MSVEAPYCTLCGSRRLQSALAMTDARGESIEIYECPVCSSFVPDYFDLWHRDTEISAQVAFHDDEWLGDSDADWLAARDGMKRVVSELAPYLGDPSPHLLICDVGTGRGNMLAALKEAGYAVTGCEPSEALVERARELYGFSEDELVASTLEAYAGILRASGARPDAFVVWHVLEHVEAPLGVLNKLRAVGQPDAPIIIQTPLLVGEYLYPEHLYFPMPRTAAWLADVTGLQLAHHEVIAANRYMTFVLGTSSMAESRVDTSSVGGLLAAYEDAIRHYAEAAADQS